MKENTIVEVSAWLSVALISLFIGCSVQRSYYPIVSARHGDRVTVEIERRDDRIEISFPDSVLQVGDTVQFFRGSVPMNVTIWDAYEEFRPLIIRP